MKIYKLMLSALAAVAVFASCNKENTTPESKNLKSVQISLENVQVLTKNPGHTTDLNGTKINLTSVQFFFSDGTSIYPVKKADGTDADTYLSGTELANLSNIQYHFIPAAANRVFAIGNMDEFVNPASVTEIMKTLQIHEEQNPDDLTLYAASYMVNKATEHPEHPETDVYTVNLNLMPRIARIEVQGALCKFSSPALYDKIDIKALGFVDYYQNCNLRTGEASTPVELELNDVNVHNFFAGVPASGVWNVDKSTASMSPATSEKPNAHVVAKADFDFAYNFFPSEGVYPRLVADVITTKDGAEASAYLATLGFHDSASNHIAATDFQPGKIYRLTFEFNDTDLEHHDRCVEMNVTVASWEVVAVSPVF